ncbi:DUF3592 domain-containing protein [Haloferula sp. BvORR071]|uniref:DUF3592 domain-containing protein n=1 Tax=Haloferula sp. BvORR071 TaxID=1396141 RepID=UPI00054F7C13|nr:DUF3592 domain-containing protein [Haloferula sp. BvORR071]
MGTAIGEKSKGCGNIFFGIIWTSFSSIFVAMGLWMAWGGIAAMRWEEAPCTITKFEILRAEDGDGFRADLAYQYEYAGQSHTGARLWKSVENKRDSYEDLVELREPFMMGPEGQRASAEGATTTCRVNPANPAESCLFKTKGGEIVGGIIFAVFGGFFVLIGIFLMLSSRGPSARSSPGSADSGIFATLLGISFCGLFGLGGFGILFGLIVPKAVEWFDMRGWKETTAEVLDGRVASHSGSKGGTTYSVDLFYRYEFGGREYRANRYSLMGGSSSGRDGKQEVIRAHPPGSKLQVYVDPDKPWHAVVNRSVGWWALFVLFPLPFIAIGVGGIWGILSKNKQPKSWPAAGKKRPLTWSSSRRRPRSVNLDEGPALASGAWESTRVKPGCSLFATLFAAVFWNGIVSIFIYQDVKLYREGSWGMAVFLSLFLTPFVVIGLVIVGAGIKQFIGLFGPAYEIQIEQAELVPGGSTRVRWRRSGGRGTVKKFRLYLVGREQATYSQGSSTSTAKSVFHEEVLFDTSVSLAANQGSVDLRIPQDAVPSFEGRNNSFQWNLCLQADVEHMPNIRNNRKIVITTPPL